MKSLFVKLVVIIQTQILMPGLSSEIVVSNSLILVQLSYWRRAAKVTPKLRNAVAGKHRNSIPVNLRPELTGSRKGNKSLPLGGESGNPKQVHSVQLSLFNLLEWSSG